MSSAYEKAISMIEDEVSIPNESKVVYTKDFDIIRDHVLGAMKAESPFFKLLYGGHSLFGSYLENLKIDKPDEFDVHVMLRIPCKKHLNLIEDNSRPGFVLLDVTEVRASFMCSTHKQSLIQTFDELIEMNEVLKPRCYISRIKLQNWLEKVLNKVFARTCSVRGSTGSLYTLFYNKCATAHNIKAICKDRTIKIDLVPAFRGKSLPRSIKKKIPNGVDRSLWFAVPKDMEGDERTKSLSFSMCAPQIEKIMLINKGNLKSSLRLLKSLRDKIGRPAYGLKSYFLKTIYLYEVGEQDESFWNQSVGFLLIHMLGVLITRLIQEKIPFYWNRDQNLLRLMDSSDIQTLEQTFSIIRHKLIYFSRLDRISYQEIRALFDDPEVNGA